MKHSAPDKSSECCYQSTPFLDDSTQNVNEASVEILQFWSSGGCIASKGSVCPILSGSLMVIDGSESALAMPEDPASYNRSKLVIPRESFFKIMEMCNFRSDWETDFKKDGYLSFRLSPSGTAAMAADKIFRKAYKSCSDEPVPFLQSVIIECVIQILRIAFLAESQELSVERAERTPMASQMEQYISTQLTSWDTISLEDICKTLHISPSYASHLFKELTGKSITQYTTDLRIAESKKLLLTTKMKIFEIAEQLQFHNTTIFCKTFRKCVQCTPKQFRDSGGHPFDAEK